MIGPPFLNWQHINQHQRLLKSTFLSTFQKESYLERHHFGNELVEVNVYSRYESWVSGSQHHLSITQKPAVEGSGLFGVVRKFHFQCEDQEYLSVAGTTYFSFFNALLKVSSFIPSHDTHYQKMWHIMSVWSNAAFAWCLTTLITFSLEFAEYELKVMPQQRCFCSA